MADNTITQSATPATLPDATAIAAIEASFSGDTVLAGVGVMAKSAGAEGARVLTLIEPAESGKQDTGNASLSSIDGKLPALSGGKVPVVGPLTDTELRATAVPVSVSGVATSAKQDTGNASLASLDGKAPALGQALAAGSVPVVLPAAQITTLTPPAAITGFATETTLDTRTGSLTETAPATDTASSGLNGRLQRIAQRLTSLIALLPTALGTGGGLKVDGSGTALPVSAASLPLPAGAATETTLGTRLSESDFDTKTGSLTETAPATDTASSGLNGRLQRIAQRLTSLITALGSPFQAGGSIGNTSFASTVADGSNVVEGAVADAAVTAGATGTISAKLRSISRDLIANIVLAAGGNIIGKVGIDQTTPGTTNAVAVIAGQNGVAGGAGAVGATVQRTTLASDDPAVAVLGTTTGAKVITDATGTIQQYLRGLVYLAITAGGLLVQSLIRRTYAASSTLTTTNFTSLANTSGWQSAAITTGGNDVHFLFQSKGQSSGTAYVDFYVAEELSDGSVYTDGATGSEGTFTAANRFNSRYLGSLKYNAATAAVQGAMKLSDVFAVIPAKCSLIAINNTGAAISATGGDTVFSYQLVA